MKVNAIKINSRSRNVAYVGLAIAIITVCSWLTVPIGPVPFTLQMFGIPLLIAVLTPIEAISAVYLFILIGAFGVPVFSGFKGGVGVLMGPTGGFLIGYLFGVVLAALFLRLAERRVSGTIYKVVCAAISGIIFTACAYIVGCIQYGMVAGISVEQAFLVSCAPFLVPDLVKIIVAAICAQPIRRAIGNG